MGDLMFYCKKCNKPLYGKERGNIEISIPNGYQHRDCTLSIHVDIVEEVQEIDEDIVENEICIPEENSFLYDG